MLFFGEDFQIGSEIINVGLEPCLFIAWHFITLSMIDRVNVPEKFVLWANSEPRKVVNYGQKNINDVDQQQNTNVNLAHGYMWWTISRLYILDMDINLLACEQ